MKILTASDNCNASDKCNVVVLVFFFTSVHIENLFKTKMKLEEL